MTRNLSSLIKRDIDSDDIVMKDLKEMLTSHENTNKKVAHRQGEHKRIMATVANTNQKESSNGSATTQKKGPYGEKITRDCQ